VTRRLGNIWLASGKGCGRGQPDTSEDRTHARGREMSDWKHISESITLPPEGGEVYWVEEGDFYKIIPKPVDAPWPETECFYASYEPVEKRK
jgi:hypothetical protein